MPLAMSPLQNSRAAIRFDDFELDLHSGELRKSGVKIKLQAQPFQILQALLERPGEVVTRDELQKRIWPSETFVDFEQGLNNAVQRIRQALGDMAETPRFVETLPRKGYRFIGAVESKRRESNPSQCFRWKIWRATRMGTTSLKESPRR
jgi:DNA-binding winged helix-turn-helix (wHTH) protein